MAKVQFHLPGGRAVLQSQDGAAIQAEMNRQRAGELPSDGPLLITNLPYYYAPVSITLDHTHAHFYLLETLDKKVRVRYARAIVTANVAGATAKAALYRLQKPSEMALRQVAKTEVTFNCATNGLKTVALPEEVELLPGSRYLIGIQPSAAAVGFSGVNRTTILSPVRTMFVPSSSLPAVVTGWTVGLSPIPAISYISEFGNQVV